MVPATEVPETKKLPLVPHATIEFANVTVFCDVVRTISVPVTVAEGIVTTTCVLVGVPEIVAVTFPIATPVTVVRFTPVKVKIVPVGLAIPD